MPVYGKLKHLSFFVLCFWEIEYLKKLVTSLQNEIQDLKEKGEGENKDSDLLKQENETSKFTTLLSLSKVSETILNIYETHVNGKTFQSIWDAQDSINT